MLPADVNGDGRTDLLLTGGNGWSTVPVAFSRGDGTFHVTNEQHTHLTSWTKYTGEQVVPGDFNGDGKGDVAVLGARGATHIGVGFSESTFAFNGLADLTQELVRRTPPCEVVHVGRSSAPTATFLRRRTDVFCGFAHGMVDRDNWATADEGGEVFALSQTGRQLTVMRIDDEAPWDLDLTFACCNATAAPIPGSTPPPPPPPIDWADYSEERAEAERLAAIEEARNRAYLRMGPYEAYKQKAIAARTAAHEAVEAAAVAAAQAHDAAERAAAQARNS